MPSTLGSRHGAGGCKSPCAGLRSGDGPLSVRVRSAQRAPAGDACADLVDKVVLLDLVGSQLTKLKLLLADALPRSANRHEVRTRASALEIRSVMPLVVEREMPGRRVVRRVDDRITDHPVGHLRTLLTRFGDLTCKRTAL